MLGSEPEVPGQPSQLTLKLLPCGSELTNHAGGASAHITGVAVDPIRVPTNHHKHGSSIHFIEKTPKKSPLVGEPIVRVHMVRTAGPVDQKGPVSPHRWP